MAELDLVKTGISGLDAILSLGIPRGNVILLEGGTGTGKTTMGVEFVYRGASMFGEPGLIVLFEVSPDKIELGDAFRLGLTLAKMRANPNTRSTHECEILEGQGLRVLPRQIPGPRTHPFSSYQNLISRAPVRRVDSAE